MEPFTALIFAMVIAGVFTKNIVQDSVFKATGKVPPSHLRQQERMRLAADAVKAFRAGRKPRAPEQGFRGFFANAWNDAWETADETRERRRAKRAERRHEKWDTEDTQAGETPAPLTGDVKPEEKVDTSAPETPDPMPEALKPPPAKPTPATANGAGGKEETAYQRYALRRRNGGQPMTAIAIADDLGMTVTEVETLQKIWGARYERENTAPHSGNTTGSAATPREQHDQKVAELAGSVSPSPADSPEDSARKVLDEAELKRRFARKYERAAEAETVGDTIAAELARKDAEEVAAKLGITTEEEMDQVLAAYRSSSSTTRPASAPAPTNATPINGTENNVTVNAETTGLTTAIAYADGMASSAEEGATSVETSIASLQGGEVGGSAIGHFTNAQELLAQAAAAFRAGQEELQNHLNVKEAYDANPDAGNKQFVTSE